jgi:hypothetical protein
MNHKLLFKLLEEETQTGADLPGGPTPPEDRGERTEPRAALRRASVTKRS